MIAVCYTVTFRSELFFLKIGQISVLYFKTKNHMILSLVLLMFPWSRFSKIELWFVDRPIFSSSYLDLNYPII